MPYALSYSTEGLEKKKVIFVAMEKNVFVMQFCIIFFWDVFILVIGNLFRF